MNRLIIIVALSLICSVSVANPGKDERRKIRQEHRMNKGKFDNRTLKQKATDTKILSVLAILAIIVFKKVDETQ